ncbi:TPA: hypothetical protein ACIYRI_004842, partial [Escherichia coli]
KNQAGEKRGKETRNNSGTGRLKNPRAEWRLSGLKTSENKLQGHWTCPNRSRIAFVHSYATR